MKPGRSDVLLLLCRIIVGAVFIYASAEKILHPAAYAEAIGNFRILPYYLVNVFAIVLPWLELIGGITLVAGLFMPGSTAVIGGLLVVFLLAIASALVRGLDISCGCFYTVKAEKIGVTSLIRNFVLLGLVVYVVVRKGGRATLENGDRHHF